MSEGFLCRGVYTQWQKANDLAEYSEPTMSLFTILCPNNH